MSTKMKAKPAAAKSPKGSKKTTSKKKAVAADVPAADAATEKQPRGDKAVLADVAAGYLANMETEGKSGGTISSYRMELKTAAAELGEDTPIADLTPERVQEYFESKRVTKLRSGKAKAKPSIDKTRRVLRLALVWAAERGIVEKAPLPLEAVAAAS